MCRISSPTRSCRWLGARPLALMSGEPRRAPAASGGQLARDLFHLEAFDHVADLDILIALEGHAAFVAFLHLAHLVLEALEGLEGALVDHDVVAQQAHLGAPLDLALGDHAAGDLADLADVEHLADLRIA